MNGEKELLIRLRGGEVAAFDAVYASYWKRVYGFCCLYLKNRDLAEEAVQDVFVKLWESRGGIDPEGNIEGYLFIVSRNHIFNLSRKKLDRVFCEELLYRAAHPTFDTENNIEADSLKEYVDTLIGRMPAQRRTVFVMSRIEKLSYKEIALKLNVSEKTVERHINEALRFLRKHLE